MSLITASNTIQTNRIDTISGTAILTLGGTNATSISLNEPATATSTFAVTGITTATGGLRTNSIDTISGTTTLTLGGTNATGVSITEPLTVNQINPISATGRMLIGTVNGEDQLSPFIPSIQMGRNGQTIRLGSVSTSCKLQTNSIDANALDDTLAIGLVNAERITLARAGCIITENFLAISKIFLYNDGTQCMISINADPYPFYIAPSTTIDPDASATSLNLGNTAIPVTIEGSAIGIGTGGVTPSTTTLNGLLSVSNGVGTAGMSLTSGGASGDLSWETRTVIQSGETAVGAMTSATTGTVSYGFSYASKPQIQLTMNLNGTGTTIIPVAVSSDTIVAGQYTGFTWIAGATSATATISWYVTIN